MNYNYDSTTNFIKNNPQFIVDKEYSRKVARGSNWVLLVHFINKPEKQFLVKHAKKNEGILEKQMLRALSKNNLAPKVYDYSLINHNPDDLIIMEYYPHAKDRVKFLFKEQHNIFLAAKIKEMHNIFKELDVSNYKSIDEWLVTYINFAKNISGDNEARKVISEFREHLKKEAQDLLLIHGDFHFNNILFSKQNIGEVRFVDPDGIISRPEHDLACFSASAKKPLEVYEELYRGYYQKEPDKNAYFWARAIFYIMRDFFSRNDEYSKQLIVLNENIKQLETKILEFK